MSIEFKVWQTLKLGTFANPTQLQEALIEAGVKLFNCESVLRRKTFTVTRRQTEINLVKAYVYELGQFREAANVAHVLDEGVKQGLSLLPLEAVFQIPLQCHEEKDDGLIHIATKPVLFRQRFRSDRCIFDAQVTDVPDCTFIARSDDVEYSFVTTISQFIFWKQ